MGTNYFLEGESCSYCGNEIVGKLHIGKSSSGWCFALHVIPEMGISTLNDWEGLFKRSRIFSEHGEEVPPDTMLNIITNRSWDVPFAAREFRPHYNNEVEFHRLNYSERGPNNLLRHKIDNKHCVGHGDGTWDYMTGWFR
jgi:hypothetical protein